MKTNNILKSSAKMNNAVAQVMKKYHLVEGRDFSNYCVRLDYGVEADADLRVGRGFYDFCEMVWGGRIRATVAHDGTVSIW